MKQYKVSEAVKQFNSGNYIAALEGFTAAAAIYGEKHFDYNIKLCQRRIHESSEKLSPSNQSYVNEYFDHVYLVNLVQQRERRLKSAIHLRQAGIEFELFSATNGYIGVARDEYEKYLNRGLGNLTRYPEYNEQEKRRKKPFIESPGAVGYIFTYLSILRDAKKKGYKKFLILEDDVIIARDFEVRLRTLLSKIDQDWKVLQLGASQYGWSNFVETDMAKTGYYLPRRLDTCGSFAIAFDHSVIDEIISAESAFDAPFDHLPMGEIYERHLGKCYVAYPNLIVPDVTESSIRGERCQDSHAIKMKWVMRDFDFPLRKPSMALFISSKENIRYIELFVNEKTFPIDLRVFCHSEDGPRPIHDYSLRNMESLAQPYTDDMVLPQVDFCAKAMPGAWITDRDIVSFVESQLGLLGEVNTSLSSMDCLFTQAIRGRVSVIIPTYKRPKNLRNAINSVLHQDYDDLEVIVVSDNGLNREFQEETRKIVEDAQSLFQGRRLKLIEHGINRNGAAARNTGILNSTGEYICFLDDDDIYLPGRISQSVLRLCSTPKIIGAVYCGFIGWNSPSNDLNRYAEGDLSLQILQLDYKQHYLHTNTATYKRDAVLALNGFDESYRRHQDLEFNLRFFENYRICTVTEALVKLNPEPSEISNKIFNRPMLDLKIKFLGQFDKKISSFGEDLAREIYAKHWKEVVKYIQDKELFLQEFLNDYKNGHMSTVALLEQIKK